MGQIIADQIPAFAVGDTRNGAISFAGQLDSGEALTGTPTVVELTTTDLTISGVAVSTTALTINGETVAIGEAVQFKVVGMTAANYRLKVTATTDSTPAQTLVRYVRFQVVPEPGSQS
jgi:hypothetical protein